MRKSSGPVDNIMSCIFFNRLFIRYNLEAVGNSLDSFVAKMEKQCARLMTTLKPIYQRCHLPLPPTPPKKPLSAFELIMVQLLLITYFFLT